MQQLEEVALVLEQVVVVAFLHEAFDAPGGRRVVRVRALLRVCTSKSAKLFEKRKKRRTERSATHVEDRAENRDDALVLDARVLLDVLLQRRLVDSLVRALQLLQAERVRHSIFSSCLSFQPFGKI